MELKDFYGLTLKTAQSLLHATCDAMNELQGDLTFEQALDSELFCHLLSLQLMAGKRMAAQEVKGFEYKDFGIHELLKEVYNRMQMLYHYGECKGAELKGIDYAMEGSVFVLRLRTCAVNMEFDICDEFCPAGDDYPAGRLFAIGFDPDIDPDDKDGEFYGHYEEALSFCCDFKQEDGSHECRDITILDRWTYREMLRTILAGLDVISERNENDNENENGYGKEE